MNNLRETLLQLPDTMEVALKRVDGTATYTETVETWLDEDLTLYELAQKIVLPDKAGLPLPPHLKPYEKGDYGGTIAPPDPVVIHGTIGEWLNQIEPHTEASLASLGLGALCGLGSYMGRHIKLHQGNITVTPNLFGVQIGPTGDARKGTADTLIHHLLTQIDPTYINNIASGFGSGEQLIYRVSDPQYNKKDEQISGTQDQRLLIQESEFSKHLRAADRQGNTISETLRLAYDCDRPLATSSRTRGDYKSTNHCISIFAGITPEELVETFPALATTSGTGNRYLWAWSNPNKLLPTGGEHVDIGPIANQIRANISKIRKTGRVEFTDQANEWWTTLPGGLYEQLRKPGVPPQIKPLVTRAYVQTMRVGLIYAVTDGRNTVSVEDLNAALGWVNHSNETVQTILNGLVRDETAHRILTALRSAPGKETTRTEIYELFRRNITAQTLDAALEELETYGLVHTWDETSGNRGRPQKMAVATTPKSLDRAEVKINYFVYPPRESAKRENLENSQKSKDPGQESEKYEKIKSSSVSRFAQGGSTNLIKNDDLIRKTEDDDWWKPKTTDSDQLPDPY